MSANNLNIQTIWCIHKCYKIAHFEKLANFRYIWTPPLSIFLVFTKSVTTFVTILSLKICHVTLQELQNVQLNPNPNPNSSPWIKPIKPACNCTHYPISVAFLVTCFSIWFFFFTEQGFVRLRHHKYSRIFWFILKKNGLSLNTWLTNKSVPVLIYSISYFD